MSRGVGGQNFGGYGYRRYDSAAYANYGGAAAEGLHQEYNYALLSGSTLIINTPFYLPSGATETDHTGELAVRLQDGREEVLVGERAMSGGDCFRFTLTPEFTAALPAGEQQYEIAAIARNDENEIVERFSIRVGFLIVRDLGGQTQEERDLQCLKDLLSNRIASGGDMNAYQFPGGATISKLSIEDLQAAVVRQESRVNQQASWNQGQLLTI